MCTCMFIEALFTIAKIWKQRRCPLIDVWLKNKEGVVCIYNGILHSSLKKN